MHKKYTLSWQRGFTLIEVMIVVAVVAILSAIALPSYQEYIRRGHRADARAGLLQAAQWMERAATAGGNYPTQLPKSLQWKLADDTSDPQKRYNIELASGNTASAFTLRAIPKSPGPQAGDKCGTYTLTNTGVRDVTGASSDAASCWGK